MDHVLHVGSVVGLALDAQRCHRGSLQRQRGDTEGEAGVQAGTLIQLQNQSRINKASRSKNVPLSIRRSLDISTHSVSITRFLPLA